jgi:hypothetical protein
LIAIAVNLALVTPPQLVKILRIFSKSLTFANHRIYPKYRGIYSVAPFGTPLAYVPGERARKGRANPTGRGMVHSLCGAFIPYVRRKERFYSAGWQGQRLGGFSPDGGGPGGNHK